MKPSVKRMLGFLGIIALLVASLIIYASFIRPEYEKINQSRGSLATKSRFFEEQSEIIKNIGDYLSTAEVNIKKSQELINSALPTDIETSSLFYQASTLARVNNLSMDEFGLEILPIKPTPAGALLKGRGIVQIELKLSGTYQSLKGFLTQLEKNIRLMDSVKLTIKTTAAKDIHDYELVINSYYQTE